MERGEIPADMRDEAQAAHDTLVERIAETDEALTHEYLEGKTLSGEALKAALRRATISGQLVPVLVRLFAAQQGCAAAARCRGGLPAIARRHSRRSSGTNPYTQHRRDARRRRKRAVHRAGVQDRLRSLRRPAGLLPRLFRHGQGRRVGAELDQGQEGTPGPRASDVRRPPRGY